ncbi:MAG TPA: hypothetical protein VFG69_05695 [Nannocystaceae bacterium]|nr:hypothetical protein [Nannocystaceae bacterium]
MSDDHDLDDAIRELPRSIDPSLDLWPEIAGRIEARARARRRATIAGVLAAAAALALFVAVDRDRPGARDLDARWAAAIEPPAIGPVVAPTPAPRDEPATTPDLIPGEAQLRLAANELAGAYDRKRSLLDRELLAVYDDNLGIVDAAIDRSRAALVERPDDTHLQRVLDRAYHHKLSLLRRASSGEAQP